MKLHTDPLGRPLFTIGHSTLPIEVFIERLSKNEITLLVDIRTIPQSRHNPQYGQRELIQSLQERGIRYEHFRGLGGLRKPLPNSPNLGWHNANFRGYADYMQTEAFQVEMDNLISLAEKNTLAILCAEAVPWKCHRSLVADALTARGITVTDLLPTGEKRVHRMNPMAIVGKGRVCYPAENPAEAVS